VSKITALHTSAIRGQWCGGTPIMKGPATTNLPKSSTINTEFSSSL